MKNEFVDAFKGSLSETRWVVSYAPYEPVAKRHDLIVAVGHESLKRALSETEGVPILATLITKASFERITANEPRGREISAIYLDQPSSRVAGFVRTVMPQAKKVALLQHAEAETPVHPLGTALEEVQIGTKQERITNERDLVPVLERLFLEVDALVATPDHRVFNILHIRPLLITSLRHRRPLLGYSASMVKAGSYAAIFTTPAQIAHQTTALMRNWNAGRKLPSPQYPEQFMVAFNVEVARSHGLPTFSTSDVRDALANLDMK